MVKEDNYNLMINRLVSFNEDSWRDIFNKVDNYNGTFELFLNDAKNNGFWINVRYLKDKFLFNCYRNNEFKKLCPKIAKFTIYPIVNTSSWKVRFKDQN